MHIRNSVSNMAYFVLLALLPFIVGLPTGANGYDVKGPVNTVSVAGSQVTLTCVLTSGNCSNVEWLKSNPGASHSTVYRGDGNGGIRRDYRERYSVENSNGCHLVIKDVQLVDAGRFTCRVFHSLTSVEKDAYLVVLQAAPKCSINASLLYTVEGDGVELKCKVTHNGSEKVSMIWKDTEDAPAAVKNEKTTIRTYSFGASAPESPSFTCITSFEVVMAVGVATNVPTITCMTPAIKILYPVRNVHLSPSLSNYPPGTNITCVAEGWPSPSFRWEILETEKGNSGTWKAVPNETRSEFVVHNATFNSYRCVAMNTVRSQTYSVVSHMFQVNDTGPWYGQLFYVILISAGAFVGLVLLVTVCCCVTRRKGSRRLPERAVSARVTDHTMGQGEPGYLHMGKSNIKETFGYVDVQRPVSDTSCSSESAT